MPVRPIDPTSTLGWFARRYATLAPTRLARFLSRHVSWKLDPVLLRLSRRRFSSTLVFPTAVLETRGAQSGLTRHNAVIYFHDGTRVTIVASNAGAARNPAWYHNLRTNPEVVFGGSPMRAHVVEDEAERQRLWGLAEGVFPAFETYHRQAAERNRAIPIIQLTERDPDPGG